MRYSTRHFRQTHASYRCAEREQKRTSVDVANGWCITPVCSHFFLYQVFEKYLISSWSFMLNSTFPPQRTLATYRVSFERKMLDDIYYILYNSGNYNSQFYHPCTLITVLDSFHFLFWQFFNVPNKIDHRKLRISERNVSRLTLIICGLLPIDLYIFRFLMSMSSGKALGLDSRSSAVCLISVTLFYHPYTLVTVLDSFHFLFWQFFNIPNKIDHRKLRISECNVSRLALIICGLLPIDLYIFRFLIAMSSGKALGLDSRSSAVCLISVTPYTFCS